MSEEVSNKFFRSKLFLIPAVLISLGVIATPIYHLGKKVKQREIAQMLTEESQELRKYLDKNKPNNYYFQGREDATRYALARIQQSE